MLMSLLCVRKDCTIFYIVMLTNVFSCGGVNRWKVFSFMSLYESRLMDNQLVLLLCRCRANY